MRASPRGVCEARPVTNDSLTNEVCVRLNQPIHYCLTLSDQPDTGLLGGNRRASTPFNCCLHQPVPTSFVLQSSCCMLTSKSYPLKLKSLTYGTRQLHWSTFWLTTSHRGALRLLKLPKMSSQDGSSPPSRCLSHRSRATVLPFTRPMSHCCCDYISDI